MSGLNPLKVKEVETEKLLCPRKKKSEGFDVPGVKRHTCAPKSSRLSLTLSALPSITGRGRAYLGTIDSICSILVERRLFVAMDFENLIESGDAKDFEQVGVDAAEF